MSDINYIVVAVSAVVVFVTSFVWYMVFGSAQTEALGLNEHPTAETEMVPLWKMLLELVRSLIVGTVLAYLIVELDIDDISAALQLGLLMWLGFPVVLLAGSVLWNSVPWKMAAVHAGDWLIKLLLISLILSLWH